MRPVRLRFSGLRSYRAEADIDFAGLDLFAVIGDTGAGKSTIIEALCLALYGKKTWSGDSIRDVIADGEDIMRVEFTFDADDHTWLVRRARRRSGAGQDLLQSTTNHVPDVNGHGAVTQRVVDLLGLTFEQFTRAVVMPQGRFDELLKSTPGVRNQILKSLLGLEDMTRAAKAAVEARDDVRPIHERYAERRRALPLDPQAELRAATAARDSAAERRLLLEHSVESLNEPSATQQATERAHAPLADSVAALGLAPNGAIETLTACHQTGERLNDELAAVKRTLAEATATVDAASQEIREALAGFANRDLLAAASSRLADAADNLPDDLAALRDARERRSALVAASPASVIDPALVAREGEAAQALLDVRRDHDEAKASQASARALWARLVEARALVPAAAAAASAASKDAAEAKAEVASAEARLSAAEEAIVTATQALEAARFADQVAAVAAGHGPGDPCPVCERDLPSGFVAPSSADLDEAAKTVASAQEARGVVADEVQIRRRKEADLAATARHRSDAEGKAREALDVAEAEAESSGIDVAADDEDGALQSANAAVALTAERLKDGENLAQAASLARATAESTLDAQRARHAELVAAAEAEVGRARKPLTRYLDMVAALPPDWTGGIEVTVESLSPSLLADLGRRLQAAVDTVAVAAKRLGEAEGVAAKAEGRRESIRANAAEQVTQPATAAVAIVNAHLERARAVARRARDAVDRCHLDVDMPVSALDDVPAQVVTTELPGTIARAEGRLQIAAEVADAARSVLTAVDAARDTAAAAVVRILGAAGCETVESLHSELGQARSQAQQAEALVAAAAAAVTQVAGIDEVLAIAGPLRENLEVLCAALGNNQFVDHLLDLREAELLAEASRRLKALTGDRFGFVADFGVKNTASGEIRSPDSLSGGERFQASLALALALVEIASRGAGRLDAVFVDEGFGSLDQNALETALATLGRVAGGGKTVALISHLRAVAEYVDTVMHVSRDDVFGSKIRTLTETERDQLLSDDIRSGLTG